MDPAGSETLACQYDLYAGTGRSPPLTICQCRRWPAPGRRGVIAGSVLRSSKGFQYLHTRDFVTALRRRGIHFSEVEANAWIAREQTYFVDKTAEHSENRLWMMANMGRVL